MRLSFDECWNTFQGWSKRFPEPPFWGEREHPQQCYDELRIFYPYIERLNPRNILEIGSYLGGTLRFWINAALTPFTGTTKIIALERDPSVEPVVSTWNDWLDMNQKLFWLNHDSVLDKDIVLENLRNILQGDKLDFLFIDGEHKMPYPKSDFDTYAPLVRKGGIIAFHDIAPPPLNANLELYQYWTKLKTRICDIMYVRTLEIISRHRTTGSAGIGVIMLDDEVELNSDIIKYINTGVLVNEH